MLMLELNELAIGFELSLPMQVLQLFLQVVEEQLEASQRSGKLR